ncbi:cytochrome P450 [Nocardioides sp. AE5]|uniref:cytochrome P450 n=1 Tax=Nocardioides sp. AE5 TaxID=2962573 RepID=UPI002882661A|nr:cytochrome P450 [Nocardioides sp. AE5]MDT0201081.1 cytochrome P450 [Nocardioides sp. AE5]
MMQIKRRVLGLVRGALLKVMPAQTIDLSRLDKVPESMGWPLKRDGFDPTPRIAETRTTEPVHHLTSLMGMGIWLVTGIDEGRAVLQDTSYSTDIRPYVGARGAADGDIGGLGFTDPPDHTRLRKLITPEFTMRRLARIQPMIDAIIERQLDEIAAAGANGEVVDLVPTFGFPVPFLVICELLGLPDRDRQTFMDLGSARFDVTQGGTGSLGAISESREFLKEATRKQRLDPGPGLIGQIIRDHGDEISDYDLAGLADGVFNGGMETSASMLAMGTAVLLGDRKSWDRIRTDEASVDPIVEELLRYLSVVQVAFPRFAKQDALVGDKQVRKGDVVLVSLPGVNRDPAFGDAPDSFDPDRVPDRSHLAFGHGLHRCVGAELARMELRAAFPKLAQRFPDMELVTSGVDDYGFRESSIVYGVESVPVRITR